MKCGGSLKTAGTRTFDPKLADVFSKVADQFAQKGKTVV
jgi:hypothetical protein